MKLLVMGLTASGKTSIAKGLAEYYSLSYLSGSDTLLKNIGASVDRETHFWLDKSGRQLDLMRDLGDYDIRTDKELVDIAIATQRFATDSWALPWLLQDDSAVRIYLSPSIEARVQMARKSRRKTPFCDDELADYLTERDNATRDRFLRLYRFDVFDSTSFDIVFDNTYTSACECVSEVLCHLSKLSKLQGMLGALKPRVP